MRMTAYAPRSKIDEVDGSFHDEFEPEFDELPAEVQDELFAEAAFFELFGPLTGRPHVDKLHGSDYANMKELRFEAMNDEWRVAFAFDPKQIAILLVAGELTILASFPRGAPVKIVGFGELEA
jgi:hypothetical protein